MRRLIARLCVLLVCARTQDVGDDGDLLDALLESMTFAISERFQESHDFLRTRAWYGNSHIGNRPKQARAYFDVARRLRPRTICEIGFNGGHSAAIFLAAAGSRASMIAFDLQQFTYSSMATRLVQAIFHRHAGVKLAPKEVRSAFVTWLRSSKQSDETLRAAALALRHSSKMQKSAAYDKGSSDQLIAAAVDVTRAFAASVSA